MTDAEFDATVTLHDRLLAIAGLAERAGEAIEVARRAVESVEGSKRIDVRTEPYRQGLFWIEIYPPGQYSMPETRA